MQGVVSGSVMVSHSRILFGCYVTCGSFLLSLPDALEEAVLQQSAALEKVLPLQCMRQLSTNLLVFGRCLRGGALTATSRRVRLAGHFADASNMAQTNEGEQYEKKGHVRLGGGHSESSNQLFSTPE